MSGPLTCLCACLYLDPFPLSLDLSMMIQRITSVNFSPGNIQPSSLHRIANGLSHALHSTTHLRSTSNVWQIGHRMLQDEAPVVPPAADIFGLMCHEMDGDVCS